MRFILIFLLFILFIPIAYTQWAEEGPPQQIRYDNDIAANSREYFGWAETGEFQTSSVWKIMRLEYTGDDFVLQWADGNKNFDGNWNNRTTLVYE